MGLAEDIKVLVCIVLGGLSVAVYVVLHLLFSIQRKLRGG